MKNKEKLIRLVQENRLGEAIEQLLELKKSDLKYSAVLSEISRKYKSLMESTLIGILSAEEKQRQESNISYCIIKIINGELQGIQEKDELNFVQYLLNEIS